MASRIKKNNLKTLLAAYRVTSTDPANDLEDAIGGLETDSDMVLRTIKAVLADLRAEDEAAKKPVKKPAE